MALWTAALFGYNQPRVLGWEKRYAPGDVVGFKKPGSIWTDREKSEFLIVDIDGPDVSQIVTLRESLLDMDSYLPYLPTDEAQFRVDLLSKIQSKPSRTNSEALMIFGSVRDRFYREYIEAEQRVCNHPIDYFNKARFHVSPLMRKKMGVNENKMLNKKRKYVPKIGPIDLTDVDDKLRKRKVKYDEGLRELTPLTVPEMIDKANG